MLKKNLLLNILMIMTISIGIIGSSQAQSGKKNRNNGDQTKETRNVSSFNAIDLSISASVYLKQEGTTSLVIEGSANDLEKIITEVSGSELKIKTRPGTWNIGRVSIYISMKEIKDLNISGSGNIKTETPINASNLSLKISGSGNINIPELSAQSVSAVISGSGNIAYAGTNAVNETKIVVTGSGNVNAEGLNAKDAHVNITGSGDCKVNASNKLDVLITGSGNVFYKGKALVNASVTGSGKVRQI